MEFVAKDILSYRYPISGSLREFDTQLDTLSRQTISATSMC